MGDTNLEDQADVHNQLSKIQLVLVNQQGPNLFHDNARSHVTRMTLQKLTDLGYETLPHPPNSLDLSPTENHSIKYLDTFWY